MTERELGIILAKLENLVEHVHELKSLIKENDSRLDKLERFKAWAMGGLAVVIGGMGILSKYFHNLVSGG